MKGKILDITHICNECMHNWVNKDGSENKYCKECEWSNKQGTMTNYEDILD